MADRVRFGQFELDRAAGQLRKNGVPLKVVGQPLQVLALLVDHAGEIVPREELRRRLWGADTFVDFEHGLNAAVNKLRFALGDSADTPRFIETIPRQGYRFLVPVEAVPQSARPPAGTHEAAGDPVRAVGSVRRFSVAALRRWRVTAAVLLVSVVGLFGAMLWRDPRDVPLATASDGRFILVVLPFDNLSDDREPYFAEGLTEEMITTLGQLDPGRLGVIARASASHYGSGRRSIREIAGALNVTHVLEGSVRREGSRVRVSAQLIRAADETQIWAQSYDRDIRDLLAVQQDLARAIANNVELRLAPTVTRDRPHDIRPEAYDAYLRGRYLLRRRTVDGISKGHDYLREAVRLDPAFALGQATLSEAIQELTYVTAKPAEAMPQALAAARKSLELDPALAEGHAALGAIHCSYDWDWPEMDRRFQRALDLNANSVETRISYSACLSYVGRLDEALLHARAALRLDPLSLVGNAQLAIILYRARDYDGAIDQLRRTLELDPNFPIAHLNLGLVYAAQGRYAEAIAALEKARSLDAESTDLIALLGYVLARSGRLDRAAALLQDLHQRAADEFVQPLTIGLVYLGLGDLATAMKWIERGYRERSWLTALINVAPELDPLRGYAPFEALVARMNFPGARARREDPRPPDPP